MVGPIGPPGFNGSQGAIGAPGPKGVGNFSACQYKVVTETPTPGDPKVIAGLVEPNVSALFSSLSPGLVDSCWYWTEKLLCRIQPCFSVTKDFSEQ